MEIFASFIQKLRDLRRIRDLEKLADLDLQWQHMPENDGYINYLRIQQQKISALMAENGSSASLVSLMRQQQTHAHLATRAALSYWQSNQNPVKITMSYKQPNKNPATVTAASLKTLVTVR